MPLDVSPKVKTAVIFANLDVVFRQAEMIGHNLEFSAGLHFTSITIPLWQRITSITGTNNMTLEGKDQHCLKTVPRKIYQSLQGHHHPSRLLGVLQECGRPFEVMGRGLLAALKAVQVGPAVGICECAATQMTQIKDEGREGKKRGQEGKERGGRRVVRAMSEGQIHWNNIRFKSKHDSSKLAHTTEYNNNTRHPHTPMPPL